MDTVRELAHPRRAIQLRAFDTHVEHRWLGRSRAALGTMAFTAVAMGIACADVSATTGPGRLGMFAAGAATGAPLGFGAEAQLSRAGPLFRWVMVCSAFLIITLDVAAVVRWVT